MEAGLRGSWSHFSVIYSSVIACLPVSELMTGWEDLQLGLQEVITSQSRWMTVPPMKINSLEWGCTWQGSVVFQSPGMAGQIRNVCAAASLSADLLKAFLSEGSEEPPRRLIPQLLTPDGCDSGLLVRLDHWLRVLWVLLLPFQVGLGWVLSCPELSSRSDFSKRGKSS